MFYVDPSDQHLAMQNLAPPQASNSVHYNQASSSPTPGTMSNVTSDQKLAHNVASRFKREDRYTGKIGEDINEVINNYCETASDYELSTDQMLKYFHNEFDGEAKRFFRSNVVNHANTFETACQLMQNEFNSITRPNRVRQLLQNLRLTQAMSTKNSLRLKV